jgi:hypothetical protein
MTGGTASQEQFKTREAFFANEPQVLGIGKQVPMSLGILNELSRMYAESNLNNGSNGFQAVLQQLSSGSILNSGADDAGLLPADDREPDSGSGSGAN